MPLAVRTAEVLLDCVIEAMLELELNALKDNPLNVQLIGEVEFVTAVMLDVSPTNNWVLLAWTLIVVWFSCGL